MKKLDCYIEIAHTQNMNINTMGKKTCELIKAALLQKYKDVRISRVNNLDELNLLIAKKPDLVFLGVKRLPFDDSFRSIHDPKRWVPDYLEDYHLSYTGSPRSALELGAYKNKAKSRIKAKGLPTADFFTAIPGQYAPGELPLSFPLFVKPNSSGGSKGIDENSVVRNYDEFNNKVNAIFDRFGTNALAEQYLTGREFSVAVIQDADTDELRAMPIEIIAQVNSRGDRILSKDIKTADTERVVSIDDKAVSEKVGQLAIEVFIALGARDFGRIDIRMDEVGKPYFLEANLIPGLSGGYFTRACKMNAQMEYDQMILNIARIGLVRAASRELTQTNSHLEDYLPVEGTIELETTTP